MAGMVSSALLSGLFNVLFDRLATEEVKNFLRPKTVINKLLKELEVLLLSANNLLDVAEEKQIKVALVKKWHNELKDVVCKADELADKIETEVLRLKMEENQSASESSVYEYFTNMLTTLSSNLLNPFDSYVKDELDEILSSLERLLSQKDALGLEPAGKSNYSGDKTRVSEKFRPTPVADESGFCGREDIKLSIIKSLLRSEDDVSGDKVSVIPVIGAGGLGKTTLVQIIYEHPEVKQLFEEVRAWITVSTEFDLPTITEKIIGKIAHPSPIKGNEDQQELLFKLRDVLKGKKFLLVLDDVWSEDRGKWNTLKSCFKSAESGSKIMVTTRSAKVASIMAPIQKHHFLHELPEEDCLKLFAQTVFSDDQGLDAYPDWQEIGEKIVRKCKGNPLSVITVGGILRDERRMEEWKKILESSLWELLQKDNENIIPSLWFSYLYLPSEIKPCFAYCSIFPKGYELEKEVVVQLWMAEGFLQNEAEKRGITMEEVGERYFEGLISRSLFQRSKYGETFIMHDLVHDLAMNVSGEFCLCLDGEKNLGDLSCKTRYLSCKMENLDVKKFEGSKAKRLHSFFVGLQGSTKIGGDVLKVLEELAMEGGCLRVLSLSSAHAMKSLPDSIGNLKHLRYLNLSWAEVEKLPDSVGTLYSLQTLVLQSCHELTQLPDSIGYLKHLRYLNLSWTGVKKLPDSIGTLYGLQKLLLSHCSELTQLPDSIGDLKHLRYLNLSSTGVKKLPDSIGTLHGLQKLLLSHCSELTQLPDSIGDLKHLRYLKLSWTGVKKLPDSIGTLHGLQKLLLSHCSELTQLPDSIGDLKHLRYLNLSWTEVKKLPDSIGTLYGLQKLLLSGCSELTQLPDSIGDLKHLSYLNLSWTGVKKLLDSVGTLYSLQTLLLSGCRSLTRLPSNLGSLINLHHLDTRDSILEEMPPHMCNLTKLQTLSDFVVGKRGSSIRDLGALHDINGDLRISGLQNVDDVLKGNLEDKKNLSKLVLEWEGQTDASRDSRKEERVLDALQPHANLKELFIYHYGGTSFPDWVGDSLFSKIERMHLNGCQDCLSLPSLGRLPSLKELRIQGFHRLDTIGDGFYGNDSLFKSLVVLHFEDMPEWKSWSGIEVPRLRELKLKGCPKLVGGLPNCNTITTLDIYGCESLDFPEDHLYPSLESLKIEQSCGSIRRLSLEQLPKLNELELKGLECLVELTGESSNEVKRLFIEKCPKLKFMGNGRYGSLKALKIKKCEALKSIPLDYFPKLNELDLKELECPVALTGELLNELKSLSIKECPKLAFMGNGRYESLKALKIKKCEALKSIPLDYFPKLNELGLKELECLVELTGESSNELKRLFIEKCPKLAFMGNGRYESLKALKIEKCEALKSIPLDYFPKLNELDLKELECLVELIGDLPDELERLSIKECPKLEFMGNGRYGSLKALKIEKCEALKAIPLDYFRKLNELDLKELESLVELIGDSLDELERLSIKECPKLEFMGNGRYGSLKALKIEKCEALKSIPLDYFPKLNELDLKELECLVELTGDSPDELERLSIEQCPKLESQWNGRYGFLKSLEIKKDEALKSIPLCYFPKLNKLTLRHCQNFESFRFAEEPPLVLESLSLEGLPKFVSFPEGGLPAPNLKHFYINECENLRSLPQQMHRLLPSLKYFRVSNCGEIESWPEGGLPSNLESLGIRGCKKLAAQVMHWDLQVTCLKSFSIDGCGEELLDSFPPEGLLPTSLTSLDICNFRRLKTLNIHAFQHLEDLYVVDCDELQCLPEESLPNSLVELIIWDCPLLERRYQKETGEGWHKISHIPKVWINGQEQH